MLAAESIAASPRPCRGADADGRSRSCARPGLRPATLDCVAVAIGPGGFTGIRVGLAAAHGIALAAGARLVGVTSFAAVAAARGGDPDGSGCAGCLLVALDSRRDDLYVQLFDARITRRQLQPAAVIAGPALPTRVEAGLRIGAPLLIAGDAAAARPPLRSAGTPGRRVLQPDSAPDARGVAAAALSALSERAGHAAPVRPLYLRPPDVTLPKRRASARDRGAVSRASSHAAGGSGASRCR